MGNYISCAFLPTPTMKNSRAVRVILPDGEIRQFRDPVKAADLMLETPNFFLVNSKSLHIGRRFSALSADEDLEFGNVYIMFPMRRVNSIVTAADMAVFFMAANSAARRIKDGGKMRISPESAGGAVVVAETETETETEVVEDLGASDSRLGLDDVDGFSVTEFKYRLAVCKSRKPMLETINEEPLRSRRKLLA